jgi:hypothetical protein
MKVSELRKLLKGVKGSEDIFVRIPEGNKFHIYPQISIDKNDNLKAYFINIIDQ